LSLKLGSALLGYSEQAYHNAERRALSASLRQSQLESLVKETIIAIRKRMPRIGGEKLWVLTAEKLLSLGFPIGRDKFVALYADLGFIIKKRKKRKKTTDSSAWKRQYKDLRLGLVPTRPEQLAVADITYIETQAGDAYLFLITDAYSKLILGYEIAHRMRAQEGLVALNMAIKNRQYSGICIHHSDRGSQYISAEYTTVVHNNSFVSSTTQDGSPYDNAVAERINRIIKEEFGFDGKGKTFKNAKEAKALMKKVVEIYNKERPHISNRMLTPWEMHKQDKIPIRKWGKIGNESKKEN
jgi:putative transposase